MSTTLAFIFGVALFHVACSLSVPFDPALIGSKHEVSKYPCGYPRARSTSLTLNAKSLTYVPDIENDNRGAGYTGEWFCQGRTDLFYTRRPGSMRIEVIPTATKPFLRGPPDGRPLADQGPPCSVLQVKQVYAASDPSQPAFEREFKKLYKATVDMKKSGAECLKKMGNLDAAIAYMHAVAFDYSILLDV